MKKLLAIALMCLILAMAMVPVALTEEWTGIELGEEILPADVATEGVGDLKIEMDAEAMDVPDVSDDLSLNIELDANVGRRARRSSP